MAETSDDFGLAEDLRIGRVQIGGVSGWLKRPERLHGRMRFQKGDPVRAFRAELEAYHDLLKMRLPVARILAEGGDFFVTEDAGPTLQAMVRGPDAMRRQFGKALCDAALSLWQLHASGVSHGRPSLKDICWSNGKAVFIDLERNDPKRNTVKGEAEDVIMFFFSAVVDTGGAGPEIAAARDAYIAAGGQEVWDAALCKLRRLRPAVALLRPFFAFLGSKPEIAAIRPFFRFMLSEKTDA